MTGKIHFNLATFYIFFPVSICLWFWFCCSVFQAALLSQMLEKMVSFQILLPLLVWEQNSRSCPFRFCFSWLYQILFKLMHTELIVQYP